MEQLRLSNRRTPAEGRALSPARLPASDEKRGRETGSSRAAAARLEVPGASAAAREADSVPAGGGRASSGLLSLPSRGKR